MLLFTFFGISFTYILILAVFHVIHVTNRGESGYIKKLLLLFDLHVIHVILGVSQLSTLAKRLLIPVFIQYQTGT